MVPHMQNHFWPPPETCKKMFGTPFNKLVASSGLSMTPFSQTPRPDCTLVAAVAMLTTACAAFPTLAS